MDIKRYIYSHCVSPVKMQVWDSYSQNYITRLLPCGKCLHCQNTHVNEWCTRLFAQRKYSKYCYFVSLDYAPFDLSNKTSFQLAKETAAVFHNINKFKTYGMHPLVLCKNHLQDFFKRLRKNTNIKIQYFSCGEYGTHADGRGYGRPHFHNIIFSNDPISYEQFVRAWTIDGYKIGRVDFVDMNSVEFIDTNEQIKVFKYVCKYIQKADFNFEKLATIDFHRAYFESINFVVQRFENLFSSPFKYDYSKLSDSEKDKLWCEYIKSYSPFVVCSRRPSIGSAYLAENLERFTRQDFRLFGLPMEGLAFPRYFLKKSKEFVFPYSCVGTESEKPSSEARLGSVLSLLHFLYNTRQSLENWCETPKYAWRVCNKKSGTRYERVIESDYMPDIVCRSLNFYDRDNKFFYQFDGYLYNVWAKLSNGTFALLDKLDIIDVLHEVSPSWERFYQSWITPLHNKKVISEKDLNDYITHMFKPKGDKDSYGVFEDAVWSQYQTELNNRYKTKLLMQNSKTTL